MKNNIKFLKYVLALAVFILWAETSFAKTYDFRADVTTKTMPDGEVVTMWGFADDTLSGPGNGIVTVPGPIIEVPLDDTTLTINLTNNLPVSVSIVIPGQVSALSPAYFDAADPDYPQRVRSFTTETLPMTTTQYTWTNLKPGTYLYMSGTHPQIEVQMGLYGALKVYAADGNAYPGIAANEELLFLYSEIDPELHNIVTSGQYGPAGTMTSTIGYKPRYFLVNGEPYKPGQLFSNITAANQTVLLRFLNAGLETHTLLLQDNYMNIIAENAHLYPYQKEQYEVLLPAGSTADALFLPQQNGIFVLYDRMLSLTNADISGSGMLTRLNVGGVQEAPVALNDSYSTAADTVLNVGSPGVLANDGDANGDIINAVLAQNVSHGILVFMPDGSFTYTPAIGFMGTDEFTYTAQNATETSNIATVTIAIVNTSPVAVSDAYSVDEDTQLTVAAPGVLLNDTDPNNDPLTAVIAGGVANGELNLNSDGSFTYVPAANFNGQASFSYIANDTTADSIPAQVTITVNPINDAPVARNDNVNGAPNRPLSINVLANDADVDNDSLGVTSLTAGAHGTTSVNPDNSVTYTPDSGYTGMDTFTYTAYDGVVNSNTATVIVSIRPNRTPLARADYVRTPRNTPVVINVVANDSDIDGTIIPSSVQLTTLPARGTAVANNDGTITYTPQGGSWGVVSFRYTVRDDLDGVSNQGTVIVLVY